MADEGEIDVLGDFDVKLEANSDMYDVNELPSKSANLLPEYTNPPWMLDQGWPLDNCMDEKSKATIEKMLLEEQHYMNGKSSTRSKQRLSLPVSLNHMASQYKLSQTKSTAVWSEEERKMFHTGMEIYGRKWTKIAELIPTRTSLQVKNFAQQFFKLQKQDGQVNEPTKQTSVSSTTIPDNPIRDTMVKVSTASPTIPVRQPIVPKKGRIPKIEKYPHLARLNQLSTKKTSTSLKQKRNTKLKKSHQNKSPCKIKRLDRKGPNDTIPSEATGGLSSTISNISTNTSTDISASVTPGLLDHKMTITPRLIENLDRFCAVADIIVGTSDDVNDEDDDIDILNDDEDDINPVLQARSTSPNSVYEKLMQEANLKSGCEKVKDINGGKNYESLAKPIVQLDKVEDIAEGKAEEDMESSDRETLKTEELQERLEEDPTSSTDGVIADSDDTERKDSGVQKQDIPKIHVNAVVTCEGEIIHFPIPTAELILRPDQITDEERTVHREFFDSRPSSKTPERYLRIRNYILDSWRKCKPNYLNKTSVRPGLKNCGDVNCIGRVHAYLECVGAINIGCDQAAYKHLRPAVPIQYKERTTKEVEISAAKLEAMRPRKRKVRDEFGIWIDEKELEGKTIEHGLKLLESPGKEPKQPRLPKSVYDPFKLIPCLRFDEEHPPPFQVEVHRSAIIVMDIHSHISKTEVIGMLGGRFCVDRGILTITMATPCNSISTGMQCEMDPVSQTQASEEILGSGMDVVGWYHSHPTFAPNPSVRDIETQLKFQEWFAKGGSKFVGVIVSPYNPCSGQLSSQTNCLTISEETLPQLQCNIPYRFDYTCRPCDESEMSQIILTAQDLATSYTAYRNKVDLTSTFSVARGITCLEKMLESLKVHFPSEDDGRSVLASIEKAFSATDCVPSELSSHSESVSSESSSQPDFALCELSTNIDTVCESSPSTESAFLTC